LCFDDDYGYGRLDIAASLALVDAGGGGAALTSTSTSQTQTTTVQKVFDKVTSFVSQTFFGDGDSKYEVTQEDIQRAYASVGFSRQSTYQEKQDALQDFRS